MIKILGIATAVTKPNAFSVKCSSNHHGESFFFLNYFNSFQNDGNIYKDQNHNDMMIAEHFVFVLYNVTGKI